MKKRILYLFFAFTLTLQVTGCGYAISTHNDTRSYTPLMAAASRCDLEGVKKELSRDPRHINIKDTDMGNATALDYAVTRKNCVEVTKYLIEQGAKVNAVKSDGITPLHLAARYGYIDIIKILIENNANINAVAANGGTPLDYAEKRGHIEAAAYLIQHGGLDGKSMQHKSSYLYGR